MSRKYNHPPPSYCMGPKQNSQSNDPQQGSFAAPPLLDADRRSDVVRRIRNHLAMLAPHQKERRTAQLLTEAVCLIEAAESVIKAKADAANNTIS